MSTGQGTVAVLFDGKVRLVPQYTSIHLWELRKGYEQLSKMMRDKFNFTH